MNVFLPAHTTTVEQDLSGHYSVSGEYHGRKFIVDDINPLAVRDSLIAMLDDIALYTEVLTQGRGLHDIKRIRRSCL